MTKKVPEDKSKKKSYYIQLAHIWSFKSICKAEQLEKEKEPQEGI